MKICEQYKSVWRAVFHKIHILYWSAGLTFLTSFPPKLPFLAWRKPVTLRVSLLRAVHLVSAPRTLHWGAPYHALQSTSVDLRAWEHNQINPNRSISSYSILFIVFIILYIIWDGHFLLLHCLFHYTRT